MNFFIPHLSFFHAFLPLQYYTGQRYTQMEHYKTYCQSHPYESITNFCADPHCLVGLCATCICEHTQQHLRRGSPPQYENVKNTFARYNERMREQIDRIEQDKEWLGAVCGKIQERRQAVRSVLGKAREDCLALVGKHFDELQMKIQNEIANEAKKNSLHCQYRLETLASLLVKEVGSLLLYAKDLSSPKFLEHVQRVEQEVIPNSNEFHLRVSRQLKENQVYAANVIYREDLLTDVEFHLKRLVNLEFLLPRVECLQARGTDQQQQKRGNSVKKSASVVMSSTQSPFSRVRNVSAVVSPGKTSMTMSNAPFMQQQILSPTMLRIQTENISKASRLSSGLKIIHESRKENLQDEVRSLTGSSVSCDKENELAHSTYCDTGSNFFRI